MEFVVIYDCAAGATKCINDLLEVFSKHVVQLKNNEKVALSAQTGCNVFS
jgi:hypothetical protein